MKAGTVRISEDLFLRWLQYYYGTILSVQYNSYDRVIEITIQHGDMPEVKDGDSIPIIYPHFTTYEDGVGNRVAIRQKDNTI